MSTPWQDIDEAIGDHLRSLKGRPAEGRLERQGTIGRYRYLVDIMWGTPYDGATGCIWNVVRTNPDGSRDAVYAKRGVIRSRSPKQAFTEHDADAVMHVLAGRGKR